MPLMICTTWRSETDVVTRPPLAKVRAVVVIGRGPIGGVRMGINRSVFASRAEKTNFYKLSRVWQGRCHIFHNLPFLGVFNTQNLLDWSNGTPLSLEKFDFARLKKTSIDYVLCDENDKPLVAIDFDGLLDGFNVGTAYHPQEQPNPWREQIMALKLKVAHGSIFPYFVVGSDYFSDLGDTVKLTLVDAIIGEVLAGRSAAEKFANRPLA